MHNLFKSIHQAIGPHHPKKKTFVYVQGKEKVDLEKYVTGEDGVHKPGTLCVYHHNYTYGKNSALL